ncbi:MAG TPA: ABC transporter permease [Allosphingosinicella sp.]|nr:ABC transporter permease [Allosphingosinicella sp.]
MLDPIRAEALKFRRHRATWGLVWIWPIGVTLILSLAIAIQVAKGEVGRPESAAGWIADAVGFWNVPLEPLGRYLVCAFVAVVFAGEYGWNTWKLIVPHRARSSLIAAKYVVALALLALGFALGAILFNLLSWLKDLATGTPVPPDLGTAALVKAHGLAALAALGPLLLSVAYTSLAAILTRSTIAALVIGLVITTVERLFRFFAPMLEPWAPGLIGGLYQILPGYHLANLAEWLTGGHVLVIPFPSGPFSMAPAASLAIVAAWTLALVVLTFRLFRRQDIN